MKSWKDLMSANRQSMLGGGPSITEVLLLSAFLSSCAGKQAAVAALEVTDVVPYWSVQGKRGDNNYIHPVVRFRVRNDGDKDVDYIQTLAVFRLESKPDEAWGNAYEYSISGEPVAPGHVSKIITLRSDSTYFSKDEPREMLENEEWEQVFVEIFLRVASSDWVSAAKVEVPRRLGVPGVDRFLQPPEVEPPSSDDRPTGHRS